VDALNHVGKYCENRKADYRDVIRSVERPKGLEKQVEEVQAQAFFNRKVGKLEGFYYRRLSEK
jgi:hypothetical protein